MSFLRRAAFRALSARPLTTSSSARLLSASRTYVTCSPSNWRSQRQWTLAQFQRAFSSDQARLVEEKNAAAAAEPSATETGTAEETGAATTADDVGESKVIAEEINAAVDEASKVAESAAEVVAAESSAPTAEAETVVEGGEPTTAPSQPASAAASEAATVGAATSPTPSAGEPQNLPFGRIAPHETLYVGNLFFETTEADLKKFFEEFGTIESVKIIHDQRGLSKGFGYVQYSDVESASRAIEARNQEIFHGRRVTVQYHRPRFSRPVNARDPAPPSRTLFIGNMSYEMSDKDLNDLFREIRNVLDVRVAIDRRSGQPRGFAHADFVDEPSATKAMAILKDKEIYGRKLRVDYSLSHGGNLRDRQRERS